MYIYIYIYIYLKKTDQFFVWLFTQLDHDHDCHDDHDVNTDNTVTDYHDTEIVTIVMFRPVQSFETQYLNNNYSIFRSIFGQIFGLRNHLKASKYLI